VRRPSVQILVLEQCSHRLDVPRDAPWQIGAASLNDAPTRHPNDTSLTSVGYLAEFVRFPMAKDGIRIDCFNCFPRYRDCR
jgi:hypothetical protein